MRRIDRTWKAPKGTVIKPGIRNPELRVTSVEITDPVVLRRWLERVDDRFMGSPLAVHPHDAIIWAMRLCAGEVLYCDAQVARLSEEELFELPRKQTFAIMPSGKYELVEEKREYDLISRWVRLRDNAADRMAQYAALAIKCGVEERKVKLAEQEATLVSKYFERVLSEVHLSPEQFARVGPAMRKHLALIEGVTDGGQN